MALLNLSLRCGLLLAGTLLANSSQASTISYELQDLGSSTYRYVYTIGNDGTLPGGAPIQLFDILFDTSIYSELSLNISSISAISTQWSQQFLGSAPGVPAAYDVLDNGAGIAVGAQAAGFAVSFIWLGAGLPANQNFEIYEPNSFTLLEVGSTQTLNSPIPLPGAMPLFLSALVGGMGFRRLFRLKSPYTSSK